MEQRGIAELCDSNREHGAVPGRARWGSGIGCATGGLRALEFLLQHGNSAHRYTTSSRNYI